MAAPQQQQPQMEAAQAQEWKGAVEARLPSTTAAAAWPHVASFLALHRYLPGIDVCDHVSGEDGRPGCVRYVAAFPKPTSPALGAADADADADAGAESVGMWAREELLERDDARRRLSYAVVASNLGFGRYVGTMTLVDEQEEEEQQTPPPAAGCKLVWAFECEPVEGWSKDGFVGYMEAAATGMAERIGKAAADDDDAANAGEDGGATSLAIAS